MPDFNKLRDSGSTSKTDSMRSDSSSQSDDMISSREELSELKAETIGIDWSSMDEIRYIELMDQMKKPASLNDESLDALRQLQHRKAIFLTDKAKDSPSTLIRANSSLRKLVEVLHDETKGLSRFKKMGSTRLQHLNDLKKLLKKAEQEESKGNVEANPHKDAIIKKLNEHMSYRQSKTHKP